MNQVNRILLIQPPFFRLFHDSFCFERYPLSLGYLAGVILSETQWDVLVLNADFNPKSKRRTNTMSFQFRTEKGFKNYFANHKQHTAPVWSEISTTIKEFNPNVVGISAMSQNFRSACIIARIAKEIDSTKAVIIGGPHPSMVGSDILNCPDIDIGVIGEGERTIVELLDAIQNSNDLSKINGIVFRRNGSATQNPRREYLHDLNSLPFPHETAPKVLKNYHQYPRKAFSTLFATRGCPYNCTFCGSRKIWSQRVRYRSPQNVFDEIRSLQALGIQAFRFNDDTFGINKKWLEQFCTGLSSLRPRVK
jgi:radical SAM superfamily enzyme YgiQ (UPF0313 family)